MKFEPIKQKRVSEVAFSRLKEAIISGDIKPGERLPSERDLAADFECSRMSIREAIRALELSGFVQTRQGVTGGIFVKELSFEHLGDGFLDLFLVNKISVPDLQQIRILIEPEIAALAARHIDEKGIARLQKDAERERLPFTTFEDEVERGTQVHKTLAEICGNVFLEIVLKSALQINKEIVLVVRPEPAEVHPVNSHDKIVQYVMAGDEENARRAMLEHSLQFGKSLLKMEEKFRQSKIG